MKNSIIKVFVFFSITSLFAIGLNTFLDKQMKLLRYEDASVWNEISKGGIDADIIIMGSSRAATHIDPQMISTATGQSCYNLGMMGHNFFIEDARLSYFLQFNKAPKTILLSLDYESLQRRPDLFNHTQFIPYLDDSILSYATKQYEGFSKYDYKLPLLKYVGEQNLIFSLIKNAINPSRNKPDRINGFFARDLQWDADVDKVLDTLTPYIVVPDSLSLDAFGRFFKDCNEKNIQLILVHSPVHPIGQNKVLNRNEIIDLYNNYSLQLQIPFLDYANNPICFQKEYFMNSTHLNKKGAKVFTQLLIEDLKSKKVF